MSGKWREEQWKKQYGFGIQPTINREIQIRNDRIKRLEADLRRMALDYLAADGQAAEAYQGQLAAEDRIKELEAKLKEAVEAAYQLTSDVIPCACHDCIEAHTTLAELKGQDDEGDAR
jgi:alkylhydroperoxidase family enzyme